MGAIDVRETDAMMIRLFAAGDFALFAVLGANGDVTRMGSGASDNKDFQMYVGRTDPAIFQSVRRRVTPQMLHWFGQRRADPKPLGVICELSILFKQTDGTEHSTMWRYGDSSQGPPPEIQDFVLAVVYATNPWFQEQKAMTGRNKN